VLGADLNEPDVATFYAPGPVGYVDYPTLAELELKSA
jgi:N-ethylmaleimide reductase